MISPVNFEKRYSLYELKSRKKRYNVFIPSTDSSLTMLNSYYDKVNEFIVGFDQGSITNYDTYMINDALGVRNSEHNHFRQVSA